MSNCDLISFHGISFPFSSVLNPTKKHAVVEHSDPLSTNSELSEYSNNAAQNKSLCSAVIVPCNQHVFHVALSDCSY